LVGSNASMLPQLGLGSIAAAMLTRIILGVVTLPLGVEALRTAGRCVTGQFSVITQEISVGQSQTGAPKLSLEAKGAKQKAPRPQAGVECIHTSYACKGKPKAKPQTQTLNWT